MRCQGSARIRFYHRNRVFFSHQRPAHVLLQDYGFRRIAGNILPEGNITIVGHFLRMVVIAYAQPVGRQTLGNHG